MQTGLVIDFGGFSMAAAVVGEHGSWIVPDPVSGENRWRCSMYWDGERVSVGALAEQRRLVDPTGYSTNIKRGLAQDAPVLLGARRFRPVEQVMELLTAVRTQAHRQHGPLNRAVVTIPADYLPGDPRRSRMVAAAEAAGFIAVELLAEAVAAVSAPLPGPRFGPGELILIYDFGATFDATLVRFGAGYHEVLGHQSIVDWGPLETSPAGQNGIAPAALDLSIACCQDLLARAGVNPRSVSTVLPIGGGCRTPGLDVLLERALGITVRVVEEPELVVVRGGAHWLPRSGSRTVLGQVLPDRIVPLSFTIPGGSAKLLRWLVSPQEQYEEGAPLARIRLASGAVWELAARTRGCLDQVLIGDGSTVTSGEWLALARH